MKSFTRILTGCIVTLLLANLLGSPRRAAAAPPASPPPPGLFSEDETSADNGPDRPRHPAERRSRRVRLNPAGLPNRGRNLTPQAQGQPLRFNLFPDVDLLADVETGGDAPLGGTYLRGRLAGQPLSEWTLVERDGAITASIHTGERSYLIAPQDDGAYAVQEIDLAALPPGAEPLLPDLTPGDLSETALPDAATPAGSGATIDLLVVYTPQAAQQAAALSGSIHNLISLAVIETNTGFQNSQITARVQLAGAAATGYAEAGFGWENTLMQLAGQGDGVLDEVHDLRDRYGADAVVLLVGAGDACGISFLMREPARFASSAFSIVATGCATGYYSFGHELGHLLGATHDRKNSGGAGMYPYSYGYQDPSGAFRTVMAYAAGCPGACPRINYWSNPDLTFGGHPTGTYYLAGDAADNRLTLNQTGAIVAAFRTAMADYNHRVYLPLLVR
ncbi:MAG TPA: M12 family metallo-peptidase [Anaerolineaceae bacterium]|nr:M12 family metallo-peptidase [Anaerolineaceae bacterium]